METVAERFLKASADWEARLNEDEWYFSTLRDQLTDALSSIEAFHEIPRVLELAIAQEQEALFIEMLELALTLMRKADTTEKPEGLASQLASLGSRANEFKQSAYIERQIDQIQNWYRCGI